jgi:hypothetical protein
MLFVSTNKLQCNRILVSHDDVRKQYGKSFLTQERTRTRNRVSKAKGFLLLNVLEGQSAFQRIYGVRNRRQAAMCEEGAQLGIGLEVRLDQGFMVADDENDGGKTTGGNLFDRVLNQGFACDRQHFLWQGFCGGQHPGAESGSWYHRLGYIPSNWHRYTRVNLNPKLAFGDRGRGARGRS